MILTEQSRFVKLVYLVTNGVFRLEFLFFPPAVVLTAHFKPHIKDV